MHFVEILGSKSNNEINETALIFQHPSMPSTDRNDSLY